MPSVIIENIDFFRNLSNVLTQIWGFKRDCSGSLLDSGKPERSIYQYLRLNGKQLLDTVALECNLPIFKTSPSLLNMEMKGVIRPLPGKLFEAI